MNANSSKILSESCLITTSTKLLKSFFDKKIYSCVWIKASWILFSINFFLFDYSLHIFWSSLTQVSFNFYLILTAVRFFLCSFHYIWSVVFWLSWRLNFHFFIFFISSNLNFVIFPLLFLRRFQNVFTRWSSYFY